MFPNLELVDVVSGDGFDADRVGGDARRGREAALELHAIDQACQSLLVLGTVFDLRGSKKVIIKIKISVNR